jgi:DNA-directed RNA polymerase subunit RPC12/RpoP
MHVGKSEQPSGSQPSAPESSETRQMLKSLQWELNRIQRTVRLTLQSKLQGLVGQSLSTLNENRELANSIQKMLDTHSLRIRCPQCGHASILRVSPRKGMPGGAFVLDHTIEGKRTFHGGSSSVPPIQLTAKPERKAKATAKTRPQPADAGELQSKVG